MWLRMKNDLFINLFQEKNRLKLELKQIFCNSVDFYSKRLKEKKKCKVVGFESIYYCLNRLRSANNFSIATMEVDNPFF